MIVSGEQRRELSHTYTHIPHCGFDLHFHKDSWRQAYFHGFIGYLHMEFGKMSIQILCSFLFGLLVPYCWVLRVLIWSRYKAFVRCVICKYFLPVVTCLCILEQGLQIFIWVKKKKKEYCPNLWNSRHSYGVT